MFEGIAKTDTTYTLREKSLVKVVFEGIAKTDTTYTGSGGIASVKGFEGIAKTDTTYTYREGQQQGGGLRVLLKQTQLTRFFNPTKPNLV